MCKYLAVAILSDEESLAELDNEIISKYQKKECDIALKVKPFDFGIRQAENLPT